MVGRVHRVRQVRELGVKPEIPANRRALADKVGELFEFHRQLPSDQILKAPDTRHAPRTAIR